MSSLESTRGMESSDSPSSAFSFATDSYGVIFFLPSGDFDNCRKGEGDSPVLHQFVCLKMLEEQGMAEEIKNGFRVPSDVAVALEDGVAEILGLSKRFPGNFITRVRGQSWKENFSVELIPVTESGREEPVYSVEGPFLKFGPTELYLLTAEQFDVFRAMETHKNAAAEPAEARNLRLVAEMQKAEAEGMKVDLAQFRELEVRFSDNVGVSAVEQENGDLLLVPSFGGGENPAEIDKRLGNLPKEGNGASLRVGKQIVFLDKERLRAVNEIIENRHIRKDQVRVFLEAPGAFLDASLVDLDMGFSLRVYGEAEFKHAYFGETHKSGIKWFEGTEESGAGHSDLSGLIQTEEDLQRFESQFADAAGAAAQELCFDGHFVDISPSAEIEKQLEAIRHGLREDRTGMDSPTMEIRETSAPPEAPSEGKVAIDIELNDEEMGFYLDEELSRSRYGDAIDFEKYKRRAFSYQKEGVRWLLGQCAGSIGMSDNEAGKHGALLADDMGLGKTFMSLVAVGEYLSLLKKHGETERPVLVVAPVSLLENWRHEAEETYSDSENPFDDTVILQSDFDLGKYRINERTENYRTTDGTHKSLRYSLKIGTGPDRLDVPRRLVLTTYATLRNYQFSLSLVDWSVVIFDEAQFIKNPNALVTRAAKALKSRFKLLMTGTPVENHLGEFWCIVDTARPGKLGAYQSFRETYIKPTISVSGEGRDSVRISVGRKLRIATGETMLRRIKEEELEGLPSKTVYSGCRDSDGRTVYMDVLACQMSPPQLAHYNDIVRTVRERGRGLGSFLSGLRRLQDVSLHPQLLDGKTIPLPNNSEEARKMIDESGKLKQTFVLLDEIKSKEEKVIIFVISKRLQPFLKIACQRMYGINVGIVNGDTKAGSKGNSGNTRLSLIKEFQSAPGFGIIIMSPLAAGTGLNVVGANHVIHLQRHWNPSKEAQATDRAYRIGQKRDVNVYLPILHHAEFDSFDVNLNHLINKKSTLKDAVMAPEAIDREELCESVFRHEVPEAHH